ncbi:hypothetical protein HY837_06920 [archaeon]|nr:hypothetical protein [archaeon]
MMAKTNQEGMLVHTTLDGEEALNEIVRTKSLGRQPRPLLFQPPAFKDVPLVFCSYICKGYRETYGRREGVRFETDSPVVYACPADTCELLRGGKWLPGHERFFFQSIESMLEKYPTSEHFRKDFQEYFKGLNPLEIYPDDMNPLSFREMLYRTDYCLRSGWIHTAGYNEIAFPKPLEIKNPRVFNSKEELLVE